MDGVVDGTGRAGEVKDVVDGADIEGLADVFFYKFESRFVRKMRDISATTGQEIVDDSDSPAFAEQGIAEMRSEKTGSAGDQRAFSGHAFFVEFFMAAGGASAWAAARPTL